MFLIRPSHIHIHLILGTTSRRSMAKDYLQLWKEVASATDEGKAVRTLAEVLVDKEGRAFISCLERRDAELCIEILDHVSRDSHFLPIRRLRLSFLSGYQKAQPQNGREACFLCHVEETCCIPRAAAGFLEDNGKD